MKKEIIVHNPIFINPFFIYSIMWITVIALSLSLESGYKEIFSYSLLLFIIHTIVLCLLLGYYFNNSLCMKRIDLNIEIPSNAVFIIIIGLYSLNFLYSGIPLLKTLYGDNSAYMNFGIPTLNVLIVTLSIYLLSKSLICYALIKNTRFLLMSLLIFLYFFLVYSRGVLIIACSSAFLLYLSFTPFNLKKICLYCLAIITMCYLFGFAGNLRLGFSWSDSSYIIDLSGISMEKDSIFAPLVWVEEYLVVSFRNLNFNILHSVPTYGIESLLSVLSPDFISKRLFAPVIYLQYIKEYTTGTVYASAYNAYGYIGMFIVYFHLLCILILTSVIKFKNSLIKLLAYSFLSVMMMLTIFTNVLNFSGILLPLFYACLNAIHYKVD